MDEHSEEEVTVVVVCFGGVGLTTVQNVLDYEGMDICTTSVLDLSDGKRIFTVANGEGFDDVEGDASNVDPPHFGPEWSRLFLVSLLHKRH